MVKTIQFAKLICIWESDNCIVIQYQKDNGCIDTLEYYKIYFI